jgi:hypothetical protein
MVFTAFIKPALAAAPSNKIAWYKTVICVNRNNLVTHADDAAATLVYRRFIQNIELPYVPAVGVCRFFHKYAF